MRLGGINLTETQSTAVLDIITTAWPLFFTEKHKDAITWALKQQVLRLVERDDVVQAEIATFGEGVRLEAERRLGMARGG